MADQTTLEHIRDLLRRRAEAIDSMEWNEVRGYYQPAQVWRQNAINMMVECRKLMVELYPNKTPEERKAMLDFAAVLIHL